MSLTIITARELERPALRDLFNDGFSGYLVPMHLDEAAFETHLDRNDIDLTTSPVLVLEGRPAAFVLVGVRGPDAWIGGMGTVPAARRAGHGERALRAAIEWSRAAGRESVWLEVIDANRPALALYEKLGFEVTRDLVVWTLPAAEALAGAAIDLEPARSWLTQHRASPEPWQRADQVLTKLARANGGLHAAGVEQDGTLVGIVVYAVAGDAVSVLQIHAPDERVATTLLRSAADGRQLRLANTPAEEAPSRAAAALGGEIVARQHEMRLEVGA